MLFNGNYYAFKIRIFMQTATNATKVSEEQFNVALSDWSKCETELNKLEAEKAKEIQEVEANYAQRIGATSQKREESAEVIQAYLEDHREAILGSAKSKKILGVTIGFRKAPKKLVLREGWTWEKVIAKVNDLFPQFLVNEPKLDKKRLMNADGIAPKDLKKLGVEITQDENFAIKL